MNTITTPHRKGGTFSHGNVFVGLCADESEQLLVRPNWLQRNPSSLCSRSPPPAARKGGGGSVYVSAGSVTSTALLSSCTYCVRALTNYAIVQEGKTPFVVRLAIEIV